MCIPASTEASCALALPGDVVTQAAITTGTVLAAVDAVLAEGARLSTNETLKNIKKSSQLNLFKTNTTVWTTVRRAVT